ncbi:class I SAM-dependent methyltransferase [Bacteroidota bacterium]
MERLNICTVCNNSKFKKYLSTKDYFLSQEKFELEKCTKCGLVFTNPKPEENDLNKYYKSENYISHSGTKKGITNRIYHIVRNYTIKKKYKTVSKYSNGKNIIDYGSGAGILLSYFSKKKWNTLGFEIDDNARKISFEDFGVDSKNPVEINNVKQNSIDAIMMWHVLEHISDPNLLLKEFHDILKDDGNLFIAVPNIKSFDARFYKKFWAALDVPRHLFHYDHNTIKLLLEKNQYTLHKIKPLIFDAYYISIISGKYSGNKLAFISGIFLGLISNVFALFHSKNYSSCLYIAKKT